VTAVSSINDEARRIVPGLLGFQRRAFGGDVRTILLGGVQRIVF
jgi:hypothetical protein